MLMHEIGMLNQVRAQTCDVACVEKFHGVAKCGVVDAFVVRRVQTFRERWFFNMRFQSRPARESMLASNGELRITESQRGSEDLRIGGFQETGMKFSELLGSLRRAHGVFF
jgi:hypothetical protein